MLAILIVVTLPHDPLLFPPNLLPLPKDSSLYFHIIHTGVQLSFHIREEPQDVCLLCLWGLFSTQELDSKAHYICLYSYLKAFHNDTLVLSPGYSKLAILQHNQS